MGMMTTIRVSGARSKCVQFAVPEVDSKNSVLQCFTA